MNEIRKNETPEGSMIRDLMANRTKTEADDWFLTFRAREAMQIVLEEVRTMYGSGEVILQPFTCSTVPGSVIAAGLTPRYSDISSDDLSMDPAALESALSSSGGTARAVILQHTYGIFDPETTEQAARAAAAAGALLIEDCAQCAGRVAAGPDGKPVCDISVHSFGLEKMIRSNFGAATWIDPDMKDTELRDRIRRRFADLPPTGAKVSRSVSQYITRIRVLNHLPMKIRRPLRSHWVARRRFVPGVDASELAGKTLLDPSVPGRAVNDRVLAALDDINSNEAQRQAAVACYISSLKTCEDYSVPAAACAKPRPLLWFPVIVRSSHTASSIVSALAQNGYYSSTWGRPLLFPGVTDPEVFRLPQAERDCPEAARCSEGIVLLPTRHDTESVKQIIQIFLDTLAGCAADAAGTSEGTSGGSSGDDFIPVLLGTETNVYNMARSFYQEYGIVSRAYGRYPLSQSASSKFVDVTCDPDFTDPESFVRVLNSEAVKFRGSKAILISCGDNYTRILSQVKDRLDPVYIPVCPEYEVVDAVNSKVRLYEYCEQAGIPYPETVLIKDASVPDLPFDFPVVLKPDDADDYYAHPFDGQKKAFIISEREDLIAAAAATYAAGYSGTMLIQEFIPGGDDNMRVVNGYKRSDGKVALMSMGRPLLEDYYPMAIGNYNVILASGDDTVYDIVDRLLGSMPYLGYFNMDLKYDPRDGSFKVFDFNPRMGRSSYYVTLAGHNLARCVVDDVVLHAPAETVRSYDEVLWADVPLWVILRYIENPEQRARALRLIRKGKFGGTFRGAGDNNPKRMMINAKSSLRSIRNYHRYFVPKSE